MKKPTSLIHTFLFAAAMLSVIAVQAEETRLAIEPPPGEVEKISEFRLYFDGDWGRGSQPSARITLTGPEGVNIPKVMNGSEGSYVGIDLEDHAIITIPGEYTLTIPAHKYMIDGKDNEEVSFVYTIVNDNPQYYSISPKGGNVEYLNDIVINFSTAWSMGSNADAEVTLAGPEGVEVPQLVTSATDYTYVISFAGNIKFSTPGDYTLTIPAGKFTVLGEDTEEIVINYTIPRAQGYDKYDIQPAEGSYNEIKDGFVLTIDTDEVISVNSHNIYLTGPKGDIDLIVQYLPNIPELTIIPLDEYGEPLALTEKGEYRLIFSYKSITVGSVSNEDPIVYLYSISGTTESIVSITTEMGQAGVFTLSGVRVSDLSKLTSGIYVVNGQKVLMR